MTGPTLQTVGLFCVLVLLLGYGIGAPGIAAAYTDPVTGVRAQDETTYANSVAALALGGGWLTPKVMGRYLLYKPPLLVWMAGLSVKLFAYSTAALRAPVLLAAVLATLLLLWWMRRTYSWPAAAVLALVLPANPLWHTFSRICYTDMLVALAMVAALSVLARDPGLAQGLSVVVWGVALAFGVMAKNVAGLLPVFVLLAACGIARRRPPYGALAKAGLVALLLVAPWHLYQLVVHPRWFRMDYVEIQLLGFGLKPPAQVSAEGPVWFYARRLWLTDPVLCVLALLGAPALFGAVRRRRPEAVLLVSWVLVTGGALLVFRYRNLPYLLYTIPPLAMVAAAYGPLAKGRRRQVLIGLLGVLFVAKMTWAGAPWHLQYGPGVPVAGAQAVEWYGRLKRAAELVMVNPDDEFYSACLHLPKVRYCFIDTAGVVRRYAPRYAYLGVIVGTDEFEQLARWEPLFRARLREYGLDSSDPLATTIVADSPAAVARMIATHPHGDFSIPADLREAVTTAAAAHRMVDYSAQRIFLLAQDPVLAAQRREGPQLQLPPFVGARISSFGK